MGLPLRVRLADVCVLHRDFRLPVDRIDTHKRGPRNALNGNSRAGAVKLDAGGSLDRNLRTVGVKCQRRAGCRSEMRCHTVIDIVDGHAHGTGAGKRAGSRDAEIGNAAEVICILQITSSCRECRVCPNIRLNARVQIRDRG